MANHENNIFILGQAIQILQGKSPQEVTPKEQGNLGIALKLYLTYCKVAAGHDPDNRIESGGIPAFFSYPPLPELQQIITFLSQPEEKEGVKKAPPPKKEEVTVLAELESLVAQYKEAQTDKVDTDTTHSVAEMVKRARKTWETKHHLEIIKENRLKQIENKDEREKQKEIEDLERDYYLIKNVNPKAESAAILYQDIQRVSRQAVVAEASNLNITLTEAQINQAVDHLNYLGLAGEDLTTNFYNLNVLSQLIIHDLGVSFDSPIAQIADLDQQRSQTEANNPYSDEPDNLTNQINSLDEQHQRYFTTSSKSLLATINRTNPDIQDNLESAHKEFEKIQEGLSKSIPNPRSISIILGETIKETPLHQNAKTFEAEIRQLKPDLRIHPSYEASQLIGLLEKTKNTNPKISPEAVRLYSIGLDANTLDNLIRNNPNSKLTEFIKSDVGQSVYKQVHFQLRKISESKLGQDIRQNVPTGLANSLAGFYNRTQTAKTVVAVVTNPVGALRAWSGREAGKRIGARLIETSSFFTQKLGSYLMKYGLSTQSLKNFPKEVAKKALVKATSFALRKLAVSIGLETLNLVIPGLGLVTDVVATVIVEVAAKTIGAAYNKFQDLVESIYGERLKTRDLLAPVVGLGGVLVTASATAVSGFIFIMSVTPIAIVSALGIVVGSVIAMGAYLGFAFLAAPMLSTLVQLDSVEKVKYEVPATTEVTPGCPSTWPLNGSFPITQGPGGKWSHYNANYSQAVDIGTNGRIGVPVISTSDGVVSFAGISGPYLNTNVVIVDTKLPNGTPFQVVYAHLSFMKVGKGQQIKVGTVIGSSGFSLDNIGNKQIHLHYEYKKIRYNQCPPGRLQLAENCAQNQKPGPGKKCVPYASPFLYTGSSGPGQ